MFTREQEMRITRDNLLRGEQTLSRELEMRVAYLSDLAETLLDATDGAAPSQKTLARMTADEPLLPADGRGVHKEVLPEHRAVLSTALAHLAVFDRVTLSRLLLDKWRERGTPLTVSRLLDCETLPGRVAYFRTALSDEAFDGFSEDLPRPTAAAALDYADSCETVALGEADYCILPLTSPGGARAESIYALLALYRLTVVSVRTVYDGEDAPVLFALAGRAPLAEESECSVLMVSIPEVPADAPAALTAASEYVGMHLTYLRCDTGVTLEVTGGDPILFLVYLCLFYPDFWVGGYYQIPKGSQAE